MGAFSLVRNGLAILASMALLEVVIDELRNKTSSEQQEMKSEQQKSENETEIEYPPEFKDTVERAKQQKMELETLLNLIDIVAKQIKEMLKKTGKLVEDGEQKSVDVVVENEDEQKLADLKKQFAELQTKLNEMTKEISMEN